jgi:hypothetical protein
METEHDLHPIGTLSALSKLPDQMTTVIARPAWPDGLPIGSSATKNDDPRDWLAWLEVAPSVCPLWSAE